MISYDHEFIMITTSRSLFFSCLVDLQRAETQRIRVGSFRYTPSRSIRMKSISGFYPALRLHALYSLS